MKDVTDLIARILLSAMFLYEAADSMMFFQETKVKMSAFNILWQQDILLVLSIVLLIIGGVLILLGYRMGLGGFLVLTYWVPVTFIAHSFWNYPAPELRVEALMFAKNLAITGGVLLLMINASGRYSVKRLMPVTRIPKGET